MRSTNPGSDEGDAPFIRITNAMVYSELQATRSDLRDLAKTVSDYPDTKKRVRSLELKFYGVLAALIAALVTLVGATAGVGR
jgi:hypothetical protein